MKTLTKIQEEVGAWSFENFGEQDSKQHAVNGVPVRLGSLAPLLGIGEEIGELSDATTEAAAMDAIGDILIYCCDFASREAFVLPWGFTSRIDYQGEVATPAFAAMVSSHGQLCHVVLKHHQGIRGYDNIEKYQTERNQAMDRLLVNLCRHCNVLAVKRSPLQIVNQTWNEIVAKRNWKDNKEAGATISITDDGTIKGADNASGESGGV